MTSTDNFAKQSHRRHADHYGIYTQDDEQKRHAKSWLRDDTVNAWYFRKLISAIDPLLNNFPDASWLTVGDGRFGSDAQYIQARGAQALPTDISDALLKQAREAGLIATYRKENAEKLSFNDESFEFTLCKESYHHFPRPVLALYEMLRVARQAVVLIEPNDSLLPGTAQGHIYRRLSKWVHRLLLRKELHEHVYEEVGNYTYSISRPELTKVALGLNYPAVAFKDINVHYLPGIEHEKLDDNGPLLRRMRRIITFRDWLSQLGLKPAVALAAIIFKQPTDDALCAALVADGYEVVHLPRNPYSD